MSDKDKNKEAAKANPKNPDEIEYSSGWAPALMLLIPLIIVLVYGVLSH